MSYGSEGQGGDQNDQGGAGESLQDYQPLNYYTQPIQYSYPTQATWITHTCSSDGLDHRFKCKHERFCECGKVERKDWDQQMDEGL